MSANRLNILSDVLKLAEADRELLVDEILASLTSGSDAMAGDWADVVAQRLCDIDEGRVKMVPGDDVLEKLKAMTHGRSR